MLSKDEILKHLAEDPLWEPDEDLTEEEWELFDEVYEEFESNKSASKTEDNAEEEDDEEDIDEEEDEDEEDDDYYYDEDE